MKYTKPTIPKGSCGFRLGFDCFCADYQTITKITDVCNSASKWQNLGKIGLYRVHIGRLWYKFQQIFSKL